VAALAKEDFAGSEFGALRSVRHFLDSGEVVLARVVYKDTHQSGAAIVFHMDSLLLPAERQPGSTILAHF